MKEKKIRTLINLNNKTSWFLHCEINLMPGFKDYKRWIYNHGCGIQRSCVSVYTEVSCDLCDNKGEINLPELMRNMFVVWFHLKYIGFYLYFIVKQAIKTLTVFQAYAMLSNSNTSNERDLNMSYFECRKQLFKVNSCVWFLCSAKMSFD